MTPKPPRGPTPARTPGRGTPGSPGDSARARTREKTAIPGKTPGRSPAKTSRASAGRRSFSEPSANEGSLAAPAGPCSIRSTTWEEKKEKKTRREVCCSFTREVGTRAWGVRGERGSRESKRGARLDARASRERAVRGPRPSPESAPRWRSRRRRRRGTIVALSSSEKPTPRVDRDARSVGPGHAPR